MELAAAQARTRLEGMLQWQSAPALSSGEVDTLFAMAKRADADGIPPDEYADWKAATVYAVGALRAPTIRNGFVYKATVAGTSGAAEPVWPTTIGLTVVDGTATWRCDALAPWTPTWNLRAAAAEGWQWKAGKALKDYSVKAGSVTAQRNQIYQACMEKAREYRRGALASLPANVSRSGWGYA